MSEVLTKLTLLPIKGRFITELRAILLKFL